MRLWAVQPGGGLSVAPSAHLLDLDHGVTAVSLLAETVPGSVGQRCRLVAAGDAAGEIAVWSVEMDTTVSPEESGSVTPSFSNNIAYRKRISVAK